MKRLINLCNYYTMIEIIIAKRLQITYDFDPRQINYYTDGGRYLGLIDKKKGRR